MMMHGGDDVDDDATVVAAIFSTPAIGVNMDDEDHAVKYFTDCYFQDHLVICASTLFYDLHPTSTESSELRTSSMSMFYPVTLILKIINYFKVTLILISQVNLFKRVRYTRLLNLYGLRVKVILQARLIFFV